MTLLLGILLGEVYIFLKSEQNFTESTGEHMYIMKSLISNHETHDLKSEIIISNHKTYGLKSVFIISNHKL